MSRAMIRWVSPNTANDPTATSYLKDKDWAPHDPFIRVWRQNGEIAEKIREKLKERGFIVGISALKKHMRKITPKNETRVAAARQLAGENSRVRKASAGKGNSKGKAMIQHTVPQHTDYLNQSVEQGLSIVALYPWLEGAKTVQPVATGVTLNMVHGGMIVDELLSVVGEAHPSLPRVGRVGGPRQADLHSSDDAGTIINRFLVDATEDSTDENIGEVWRSSFEGDTEALAKRMVEHLSWDVGNLTIAEISESSADEVANGSTVEAGENDEADIVGFQGDPEDPWEVGDYLMDTIRTLPDWWNKADLNELDNKEESTLAEYLLQFVTSVSLDLQYTEYSPEIRSRKQSLRDAVSFVLNFGASQCADLPQADLDNALEVCSRDELAKDIFPKCLFFISEAFQTCADGFLEALQPVQAKAWQRRSIRVLRRFGKDFRCVDQHIAEAHRGHADCLLDLGDSRSALRILLDIISSLRYPKSAAESETKYEALKTYFLWSTDSTPEGMLLPGSVPVAGLMEALVTQVAAFFGSINPRLMNLKTDLAMVYLSLGRVGDAKDLLLEMCEKAMHFGQLSKKRQAFALALRGRALVHAREVGKALQVCQRALPLLELSYGADNLVTLVTVRRIATIWLAKKQWHTALSFLERALVGTRNIAPVTGLVFLSEEVIAVERLISRALAGRGLIHYAQPFAVDCINKSNNLEKIVEDTKIWDIAAFKTTSLERELEERPA